jgi:H/ACA ribonucleoprotein complex non-core subunit NAF1
MSEQAEESVGIPGLLLLGDPGMEKAYRDRTILSTGVTLLEENKPELTLIEDGEKTEPLRDNPTESMSKTTQNDDNVNNTDERTDPEVVIQATATISEERPTDSLDIALAGEEMVFSSDEDEKKESEQDSEESLSGSSSDDEFSEDEGGRVHEVASDDEETTGPLKTKNEIIDEPAPTVPSDFHLTTEMPIEFVGELFQVVEKTAIIKAAASGEFRILRDNSIFCFEDRQILGVLYETFGRVQSPAYSVKFNTEEEVQQLVPRKGQKVYYVVPASSFVFTATVKAVRGSDASNWHDEEVPEEEQEFSDDEKEMESKAKKKKKRKAPKEGAEQMPSKRLERTQNRRNQHYTNPNQQYYQYPPQLPPMPWLPQQYNPNQFSYGAPSMVTPVMPMASIPMYQPPQPPQPYNSSFNGGLPYEDEAYEP